MKVSSGKMPQTKHTLYSSKRLDLPKLPCSQRRIAETPVRLTVSLEQRTRFFMTASCLRCVGRMYRALSVCCSYAQQPLVHRFLLVLRMDCVFPNDRRSSVLHKALVSSVASKLQLPSKHSIRCTAHVRAKHIAYQ